MTFARVLKKFLYLI